MSSLFNVKTLNTFSLTKGFQLYLILSWMHTFVLSSETCQMLEKECYKEHYVPRVSLCHADVSVKQCTE